MKSDENYSPVKSILNALEKNLRAQKKQCAIVKQLDLRNDFNYNRYLKLCDINHQVMLNRIDLYNVALEGVFDSTYEAIIINSLREDQVYDLIKANINKYLTIKKNGVNINIEVCKISKDNHGFSLNPVFCNAHYTLLINNRKTFFTSLKGLIDSLEGRNIKSSSISFKDIHSSRMTGSFIEAHINTLEVCE